MIYCVGSGKHSFKYRAFVLLLRKTLCSQHKAKNLLAWQNKERRLAACFVCFVCFVCLVGLFGLFVCLCVCVVCVLFICWFVCCNLKPLDYRFLQSKSFREHEICDRISELLGRFPSHALHADVLLPGLAYSCPATRCNQVCSWEGCGAAAKDVDVTRRVVGTTLCVPRHPPPSL